MAALNNINCIKTTIIQVLLYFPALTQAAFSKTTCVVVVRDVRMTRMNKQQPLVGQMKLLV